MKRFAPRRQQRPARLPAWARLMIIALASLAALALAPAAAAGLAWVLAAVGGHGAAVSVFLAAAIAGAVVLAIR